MQQTETAIKTILLAKIMQMLLDGDKFILAMREKYPDNATAIVNQAMNAAHN